MNCDPTDAAIAAWAARALPARLDPTQTAKLLGFAENDIQILMAARKLIPLGDPAPNAPKWFPALEIIRLATNFDWLDKATKEVSKYWRRKRERSCGSQSGHAKRPGISPIPSDATPKRSTPKGVVDGSSTTEQGERKAA